MELHHQHVDGSRAAALPSARSPTPQCTFTLGPKRRSGQWQYCRQRLRMQERNTTTAAFKATKTAFLYNFSGNPWSMIGSVCTGWWQGTSQRRLTRDPRRRVEPIDSTPASSGTRKLLSSPCNRCRLVGMGALVTRRLATSQERGFPVYRQLEHRRIFWVRSRRWPPWCRKGPCRDQM